MADAPAPKTTFHITPARPKGTLADYDAGNLKPPNANGEGEVPRAKPKRRAPNPPRDDQIKQMEAERMEREALRRAVRVEEEIEAPAQGQPLPYQRVLADLLFKRQQIEIAIKALKELYE